MCHWDTPPLLQILFQSNLQTLEVVTKFGFPYLTLGKATGTEGMETNLNVLSRSKDSIFKKTKKNPAINNSSNFILVLIVLRSTGYLKTRGKTNLN